MGRCALCIGEHDVPLPDALLVLLGHNPVHAEERSANPGRERAVGRLYGKLTSAY